MMKLVYFATLAPSLLASELEAAGYCVYEALAISEVFHLCDSHDVGAVIISNAVPKAKADRISQRRMTLRLGRNAGAQDVIWELSNLFPVKDTRLQ